MPRIDNSDPRVRRYYNLPPFNDDDPGDEPPIDVCYMCYFLFEKMGVNTEVAHPDYDDDPGVYQCRSCGVELCVSDN